MTWTILINLFKNLFSLSSSNLQQGFLRVIYHNKLKYFLYSNLISPKQSGFRPGDSCVNQPYSVTRDSFTSFDNNLEVRGVFLDISKAFGKMWHDGLKQNGKSG